MINSGLGGRASLGTDPVVNVLKTKRLECPAAITRSFHFRRIAFTHFGSTRPRVAGYWKHER